MNNLNGFETLGESVKTGMCQWLYHSTLKNFNCDYKDDIRVVIYSRSHIINVYHMTGKCASVCLKNRHLCFMFNYFWLYINVISCWTFVILQFKETYCLGNCIILSNNKNQLSQIFLWQSADLNSYLEFTRITSFLCCLFLHSY